MSRLRYIRDDGEDAMRFALASLEVATLELAAISRTKRERKAHSRYAQFYGGIAPIWGSSLTPAQVNHASFGINQGG